MKIYGFLNSGGRGRAFAHLFLFFGAYARVSCKRQGLGSSLSLVNSDCTLKCAVIVCRRRIVARSVASMCKLLSGYEVNTLHTQI